ncbi:hypothetical protein [Streptomyces sp. x-45]|uniref:hypothetical protein n=1 Tax=Streptomyces sp. x-45 TaxID=2789281 RepID=UPI003980B7CE
MAALTAENARLVEDLSAIRSASASETYGARMRVKPGRPCIANTATPSRRADRALIAPMLDLSVVGLLVALRFLALRGVPDHDLKAGTRLLHLCGLLTLALNTAEPLLTGRYGRVLSDHIHAYSWSGRRRLQHHRSRSGEQRGGCCGNCQSTSPVSWQWRQDTKV